MLNIRTLRAVLALAVVALAVVVVVSPASSAPKATPHDRHLGRQGPRSRGHEDRQRLGAEQGRERHGRAEGARPDPRGPQDRPGGHRSRRHRRRARLGRRARLERLGRPAVPVQGDAGAVPGVRTRTRSRTARARVKRLYGAPVALENIALVTNTKLAKVPTSFADMEKQALAAKKKMGAQVGLSVQQGSGGDAYHMYPLFSGLCGYIFGTNSAGNLDPSANGVANPKFLKNAGHDRHLEQARPHPLERRLQHLEGPVPQGQDGVLLHGPVEPQRHPQDARPADQDLAVPEHGHGLQVRAVPRRPGHHGHEVRRRSRRRQLRQGPGRQLHDAAGRTARPRGRERPLPGEHASPARRCSDKDVKAFGAASVGGVPMPNIPQMASVWGDLGSAWVRSTKGPGAIPAKRSFIGAQKSIAQKIG